MAIQSRLAALSARADLEAPVDPGADRLLEMAAGQEDLLRPAAQEERLANLALSRHCQPETGITTKLTYRGRPQDLPAVRNPDGGPGEVQRLVRPHMTSTPARFFSPSR